MTSDPRGEPTRLTSASTTVYGRVLPAVWSAGFGIITLITWLGVGENHPAPPEVRWVMAATWAFGSLFLHGWLGRLRHVSLDGDTLVVGHPRRGTRIPLREVQEVKETRAQKMKWIKVTVGRATPVGRTIRFMPKGREGWLTPWALSPVAEDLQARVLAAGGGAQPRNLAP